MNRALLATLIATAGGGITASPALAAGASARCPLPGYVSGAGAQPCPSTTAGQPAERPQILGFLFHPISSLAKDVLGKVVGWVDTSAADALRYTESLIAATTRPAVTSTWFSATYWRVAALSALLTLPFLFAACIHALVRADLAMAARAAFAYLPLAMVAITIAAPLTALVLAATDQMCGFVSDASGSADTTFLGHAATAIAGISVAGGDAFLAFFAGLLTVAATVSLWIELIIRAAAVEVIVLMLPLFFAAMVWPARRIWAIRAIETLIALILSKFAIIAVLTLGAAAITQPSTGPTALLTGATLVLLAVFSPWALLRVLPLHEVAAAAAGGLSAPPREALREVKRLATGAPRTGDGGGGGGAEDLGDPDPSDGGGPEAVVARLTAAADKLPRSGGRVGAEAAAYVRSDGSDAPEPEVDARGNDGAEPGFDAETEAGLVAINDQGTRAGSAGSPGGSAMSPDAPGAFTSGPSGGGDGRPPLPSVFAPGWRSDVLTIGDRMAPRFDVDTPLSPDPDARDASAVPGGIAAAALPPPPPEVPSPPPAAEVQDPWGPAGGQPDE